jgi:hypothetical protein
VLILAVTSECGLASIPNLTHDASRMKLYSLFGGTRDGFFVEAGTNHHTACNQTCLPTRTLGSPMGHPAIGRDLNPQNFLNYMDLQNEETLVEKTIELDHAAAECLEYLRPPYFRTMHS